MSGRGRGRGRGRGFTPPTGGLLLLRRSAEECGLDSGNLRSLQEITRPRLFPDIELHSSGMSMNDPAAIAADKIRAAQAQKVEDGDESAKKGLAMVTSTKRSDSTIYLISKSREISHRIQNSAYFVKPTKELPDVIRYSDKKRRENEPQWDASSVLANCLGGRTCTSQGRFMPQELVSGQRMYQGENANNGKKGKMSFEDLEEQEKQRRRKERLGIYDADSDEGDLGDKSPEPEEDEDNVDYDVNHYESDDESDGGGNEEPTFT